MSRNKNGQIHIRICTECGNSVRDYRIVVKREHLWVQAKREWLPHRTENVVCKNCLHLVKFLDTVELIKNPELETR